MANVEWGVTPPPEEAGEPYPVDDQQKLAVVRDVLRPDQPTITVPIDPTVDLLYGVEIDGTRHTTAVVRELRGLDEEFLSSLDADRSDYFPLLVDRVISRATISVGPHTLDGPTRKLLQELLIGDRDLLFFHIMLATYGETRQYNDVVCPVCGFHNDIEVDLRGVIEIKPLEGKPELEFTCRDGVLVVRFPTGQDQQAVLRADNGANNVGERNTTLLSRCIVALNGQKVANAYQLAREMNLKERRDLINLLADSTPGPKFKEVEVPCHDCGESRSHTFGWADLLSL